MVSASPRRRSTSTSASTSRSSSTIRTRSSPAPTYFKASLWWFLCFCNWVLDFGRPVAMDWAGATFPALFPISLPSLGDYFHMLYNIAVPWTLDTLIAHAPRKVPNILRTLMAYVFIMGASIHLVADSVNHRLRHVGYQNDLTVAENPIMKSLLTIKTTDPKVKPAAFVSMFELLYFYDERFGHLMWYIPFFAAIALYFWGCVTSDKKSDDRVQEPLPRSTLFVLLPLSSVYWWYLSTEGQITPLFLLAWIVMVALTVKARNEGRGLDSNGRFLLYTFSLSVLIIAVWVGFLWNDKNLRARYPGFFYVPEPWTYKGLYGPIIPGVW